MSSLAGALVPNQWPAEDPALTQDEDEEMEDLFGNEEQDQKPDNLASPAPSSDNLSTSERERRKAQEYEEDDAPPEITVEVREALVEFPNIPVPKSSNGDNWVIRVPNFVKVDPKPESQQAESLREKSMSIKLKVENTVRWRWTKDADDRDIRQSNSRIIRWSDGTMSLRLGKELFDINQSIDTSGAKSFGASQSQASQCCKSEALSETHRMLVRAVGQKHNKVARLRMAPDPTTDPEREKLELMKQNARKSKRKADSEDGGRHRRSSRKSRGASVWSDDDDDDVGPRYASDDEEEDGAGSSGRRSKIRSPDDDKKENADYQRDGFVVDSDDEDGSDVVGVGNADDLDRMDAQINQLHNTKRRRESGGSKEEVPREDADDGMDVESEEEDPEEHRLEEEEEEE
ncbi:RNA polymerase II-associated protein [Mycena rebaudengoi]|nr:RNA polymerase II-associated protein [Mycena rebaudengoi]